MSEPEYDTHIAPLVAELAKACKHFDMPFSVLVQCAPDLTVGCRGDREGSHLGVHVAAWVGECCSGAAFNVDRLLMTLLRWAKEHGYGGSAYLRLLSGDPMI